MKLIIKKVGNSMGITIPVGLGYEIGDEVTVYPKEGVDKDPVFDVLFKELNKMMDQNNTNLESNVEHAINQLAQKINIMESKYERLVQEIAALKQMNSSGFESAGNI